ncbi:Ephrin [Cooperia oncophora]
MFIVRSSYRGPPHPWDSFRVVFIILIMAVKVDALIKKAVVEWSPSGEPFRDPMIDHAALVELHLLDRIVFACDKSVPAVIYKVSEESFAECKYDLSAQWVGECSRGLKYVTVSLRSLGIGPTQAAFYPNKTYFFTSFSSGTTSGIGDKMGGLCDMGVRLILEVRDSTVRVPLKPRSGSQVAQVPVQRVSYGGMPEKTRQQRFHEGPPFMEMRTFSNNGNLASNLYNAPEEENESSFLFGWPWLDRQIADDNSRIQVIMCDLASTKCLMVSKSWGGMGERREHS